MRLIIALLLFIVVAISICTVAFKQFKLPPPSGPYEVGTRLLPPAGANTGTHPGKSSTIRIWYPAAASSNPVASYSSFQKSSRKSFYLSLFKTASRTEAPPLSGVAPFPVLLFAHRWGGQENQNTLLAEDLASHGYIVASMNYFSDPALTMSDAGLSHLPSDDAAHRIALWNQVVQLWAADELSMLDRLTQINTASGDELHGLLDTKHAGAIGHSFGGAAALRLCGLDPRIQAAVNLDGWSFGALRSRTGDQPILIMYEQAVMDRRSALIKLPTPGSTQDEIDRADNDDVDASLERFGGQRLYVAGAQHMDFSDAPFLPFARFRSSSGPIKPERMRMIVGRTVLDFFDQTLRKRTSGVLGAPRSLFPEVTDESWPSPAARDRPIHNIDFVK